MNDLEIQAQAYAYFLGEAPELLQTIEYEILTIPNEHTTTKVHSLMRALHTLKGASANVGLETIERIAHNFEDVTRVFYNLEVKIDLPIQSLLLDGYSGLYECLNAQIVGKKIDEELILCRIAETVSQLKSKLGDWSELDIDLPTSIELGFDIVASIFETTIQEQIDQLGEVIDTQDLIQIAECLQTTTDICIGLAESFELPGFIAINQTIMSAIALHPDRIESIAHCAVINLRHAAAEVLAGDRVNGGNICPELLEFTEPLEGVKIGSIESPTNSILEPSTPEPIRFDEILASPSGEAELPGFRAYLTSDKFRTRHGMKVETQNLFDQILRLCWDWFRHKISTPHSQLNLELLVTADGLADLDYLHHWIKLLLEGVSTHLDTDSLRLYRKSCVYQVVFAVAKYLAETKSIDQITPEFLTELRLYLQNTVLAYHQQPAVTLNERGWIDRIIIPHNWVTSTPIQLDPLMDEMWGQPQIEPTLNITTPDHQQREMIDKLQIMLIESHHQSVQHFRQLQDLCSGDESIQLGELTAGATKLSLDLSLALETASALYQVSCG